MITDLMAMATDWVREDPIRPFMALPIALAFTAIRTAYKELAR